VKILFSVKQDMKLQAVLQKKWGISIELLVFFIIAMSTIQLGVTIPLLVALFIISMKTRQLKWIDVGFDTSDIKLKHFIVGILIAGFYQIIFYYIIEPGINLWLPPANIDSIGSIKGNLGKLITWVLISWTIAAVFEELIFRGYLINRLTDLLGNSLFSKAISIILAGLAFGFVHYYQGMHGIISAGVFGVFQSILFFLNKKKLVIPMITHGTFDTISFLTLYMGMQ